MNKKQLKNKALILSSALLILASTIGGIAYAKYITKISGSGFFPVAKWRFDVELSPDEGGMINLGNQSFDSTTLADGKIAPGTSGYFEVRVDANGTETGVDYNVEFDNIVSKPENLYFLVDDSRCNTFDELADALSGHFDADDPVKKITKSVQWKWEYETTDNGKTEEQNDMQDTYDGENASDFAFEIDIIGTQSQVI